MAASIPGPCFDLRLLGQGAWQTQGWSHCWRGTRLPDNTCQSLCGARGAASTERVRVLSPQGCWSPDGMRQLGATGTSKVRGPPASAPTSRGETACPVSRGRPSLASDGWGSSPRGVLATETRNPSSSARELSGATAKAAPRSCPSGIWGSRRQNGSYTRGHVGHPSSVGDPRLRAGPGAEPKGEPHY